MLIIGYDPGGMGQNGIAILDYRKRPSITVSVNTVNSVDDALNWVHGFRHSSFDAIGIDTLLSWSTCAGGWRPMDRYLRKTYPAVANSVVSPNSLRGAMTIQGMAMAVKLRNSYRNIKLNETHPKVLYYALTGQTYSFGTGMINWLLNQIGTGSVQINNEHEWDAMISAWATYLGHTSAWTRNLVENPNNLVFPTGTINYYWP